MSYGYKSQPNAEQSITCVSTRISQQTLQRLKARDPQQSVSQLVRQAIEAWTTTSEPTEGTQGYRESRQGTV